MSSVSSYMRTIAVYMLGVVLLATASPALAAETPFEISGWIPYWRSEAGVASILPQVKNFTEVNPFIYTVKLNGELFDASSLADSEWVRLRQATDAAGVLFIPTVMWANPDAIDAVLRDPVSRQNHIKSIAREVFAHDLDGIDIDYEGKYAKTRESFSQFLKELDDAIGFDRRIECTIEARTPLDSRYRSADSIPTDIEYANDLPEIGKYCDRVRIMAYDQGRIDVKLNDTKGDPYVPVADTDWVEKVVRVAAAAISPEKLVIGVPTYGYEYDMFDALDGSGKKVYSRLWSFNPGYAKEAIQKLGIQPVRDTAGELTLTFPATQSIDPVIPLPFATRVLSWSDAEAIRQKADLAQKLGVRGIALFKIDGGQDPNLWDVLSEYRAKTVALSSSDDIGASVAADAVVAALPTRNLEYGDRSQDVLALQKYLNQSGFTIAVTGGGSPGKETQYFGPATRTALARFQTARGVTPASGYYGPKTRAAIAVLR